MEENELYNRIGETDLNPTYKDGQIYQHTDINNQVSILKTAVNENYYDIQRLQKGEKTVGNSKKLDGATLSRYIDEELQADDDKIPSSQQAKAYMDALFAGYSAPVRGVDYWTESDQQQIVSDTASNVISEITPDLEEALAAKANINDIPTKISDLQNDSDFLSENNLQMVNTTDIQNGSQLTDATGYSRLNKIYGDTSQNGTPTPDNPIDINTVTGDINVTISNSDNTLIQTFALSLKNIELCKIGNYQDYIYQNNGKWYLEKQIGKIVLDGTQHIYSSSKIQGHYRWTINLTNATTSQTVLCYCDYYKGVSRGNLSQVNTVCAINTGAQFLTDDITTANNFKAWLETHNTTIYYILNTPTTTEITDTTLINQLNSIYNFQLYQNETNFIITSDNLIPKLNITYAITNRDIYSKEETDDLIYNKLNPLQKKLEKNCEVHFVYRGENGGDASIIKTKYKTVLIDFGVGDYIDDYISYLISNNITKIDYVNISHFDNDHTGTFTGFKKVIENTNLDFSNCVFIFHSAPNWSQYVGDNNYQTRYEQIVNYLTSNNYTIKYPNEEEIIILDDFNKLKFYNVDSEYYSDYNNLSANAFSVYIELISNNKHILFTGDGLKESEENIYQELDQIDLLKIPHHGVEKEHSSTFMKKINPSIGVIMNTTSTFTNRFMFKFFMDNYKKLYTTNESHNIIAEVIGNEIKITSENGEYSSLYTPIITANTDLNDLTREGRYQCNDDNVSASLINMPYNYGTEHYTSQFILEVEQITTNIILQTLKTLNMDNIIWTRKYNGTYWTEWQKYRISTFNFIRAILTNEKPILNDSWNVIPIDDIRSSYVINNALILDEQNNSIKIGKGVNHISVSGQCTWNSLTDGDRINVAIFKNTDRIVGNDTTSRGGYYTQNINCILSVSENDIIRLQARNLTSTTSKISKNPYDTILEVSVID